MHGRVGAWPAAFLVAAVMCISSVVTGQTVAASPTIRAAALHVARRWPVRPDTPAVTPPTALTLDTAIALALRVATPVQQGRYATQAAGTEVTRGYAALLPSVGTFGGRTVTTGNPLVGSRAMAPWDTRFETMGYQLSTSLNLLGGLTAYPAIQAARYTQQATGLALERTQQSVTLDVSQAYLQTLLDTELVAIARQNLGVSQQRVGQLAELVRVGKRPPADQFRAQAQQSADESIVFDSENRLRADEISLLQRLHIDPQRSLTLAPPTLDTASLGPQYRDTTALVDAAIRRRPDLQSAETEVDATRWGLRRASREALPSLSVGFSLFSIGRVFDRATQGGVNQVTTAQPSLASQVGNQATTVFSVGLGYNLYDLFRSRLDHQQAEVSYGSAELAAGDVRRQVTGDVARAVGEYGVAVDRLASTAAGLSSAQAAYDLVSGRFNVGFSSIVDLLTAQAALFQAQSLRAQAVVQLSLAKRALAYAIGLPPTDHLP